MSAESPKLDDRFPGGLIRVKPDGTGERLDGVRPSHLEKFCASLFKGLTQRHPCIGSRTVSQNGNLFIAVYQKMEGVDVARKVLRDLSAYYLVADTIDNVAKTLGLFFIISVESPLDFAEKYWRFVQTLHNLDMLLNGYDNTVSSDPSERDFELSLAGRALFTTTLNPAHPRVARRGPYPIWVCNQKSQFDQLRAEGRFEAWHKSISDADAQTDPSGVSNPMLANHGYASAADQLAGHSIQPVPFTPRVTPDAIREGYEHLLQQAERENSGPELINFVREAGLRKFGP